MPRFQKTQPRFHLQQNGSKYIHDSLLQCFFTLTFSFTSIRYDHHKARVYSFIVRADVSHVEQEEEDCETELNSRIRVSCLFLKYFIKCRFTLF